MKTAIKIILVLLLVASAQAVMQEWVEFYDGTGLNDSAVDIANDSSGNVLVTGSIYGNGWEYGTVILLPIEKFCFFNQRTPCVR